APVPDTDTILLSPERTPHAPPTDVTIAFVRYGNVRAVPFTVVMLTTGAVLSTMMFCGFVVPVLPAVSDCVAVTVYVPFAENAVVGVKFHTAAVHVAVPLCVLAPVIDTFTVALTPAAFEQVPPKVVTVALVEYGNVRVVPLTVARVIVGAAVWTVIPFAPEVPVFPAASFWFAVTE